MPEPLRWPDELMSTFLEAAPALRVRPPARAPDVVADALAAAVPGCDWAAVVFPVLRSDGRVDRPFRDSVTHPVLLGVLAAETASREGPVRELRRRTTPASLSVADATTDDRWPRFARQLQTLAPAVRALAAVPVHVASRGVVILAAGRAHALDLHAEQLAALVAPVELFLRLAWAEGRAHQLGEVMEARQVIGTATGVVMATDRVEATTALERLRTSAQRTGRPLHDVAAEIVADRVLPDG